MNRTALFLGVALFAAACSPAPKSTPEADPVEVTPEVAEPEVVETPEAEVTVQPEMDAVDRVEDTCGLAGLEQFVGQNVLDIDGTLVPEGLRVVGPDTQVTMDYVPTRANMLTDDEGTVIGLKCG
jgi:hypothetical protein